MRDGFGADRLARPGGPREVERQRQPDIRQRHAEIEGRWTLKLAEEFVLTGRADPSLFHRVPERARLAATS